MTVKLLESIVLFKLLYGTILGQISRSDHGFDDLYVDGKALADQCFERSAVGPTIPAP